MGHAAESAIVYVGLACLPQPLVAPAPSLAVELEVDLRSRRIVAANTNLQFPGLERLLREVLVDKPVDALTGCAMLELEVRYSAPFATALRAAVQGALRRAEDGATSRDKEPPRRVAVSSA
jgi:hypothetical protein